MADKRKGNFVATMFEGEAESGIVGIELQFYEPIEGLSRDTIYIRMKDGTPFKEVNDLRIKLNSMAYRIFTSKE